MTVKRYLMYLVKTFIHSIADSVISSHITSYYFCIFEKNFIGLQWLKNIC